MVGQKRISVIACECPSRIALDSLELVHQNLAYITRQPGQLVNRPIWDILPQTGHMNRFKKMKIE